MVWFGSVFASLEGGKGLLALRLLILDGDWSGIIPRSSKICFAEFQIPLRTQADSKMRFKKRESPLFLLSLVVFPQDIPTKIAVKAAPHAVHMVGVVLHIVILQQKGLSLHTVVVALSAFF